MRGEWLSLSRSRLYVVTPSLTGKGSGIFHLITQVNALLA